MNKLTLSFLTLITLLFTACQETTTTASVVDIGSISLDEKNISLYATDATFKTRATVTYKDNSTAPVTQKVQWTSSNLNLFTVSNGEISIGTLNGGDANLTISYKKYKDTAPIHVYKLTSFHIVYPDINSSGTGTYTFSAFGGFDNNETNRVIQNNISWSINGKAVSDVVKGIATITFTTGDSNVTATMFGETNSSSPIAPISIKFRVN